MSTPNLRSLHRGTRRAWLSAGAAVALAGATIMLSAPAYAATANIDHIGDKGGRVQLVVSVGDVADGATPDLNSVKVTFQGEPVESTAEALSDHTDEIKRTTVLAMDVSDSMAGHKFDEAKAAADAFLKSVPADVNVGLITFAGEVTEVVKPTQDHTAVSAAVDALQLSHGTLLYDGLIKATEAVGTDGSRSILVLSDGGDTSDTPFTEAVKAVKTSQAKVDVVALAQSEKNTNLLQGIADAGNGTLIPADDPAALSAVFEGEAQSLATQILVTATPTDAQRGQEGTVAVSLDVDGQTVSDNAFIAIKDVPVTAGAGGGEATDLFAPAAHGTEIPKGLMFAGLAAAGVALAFIIVLAVGGAGTSKQDQIDDAIEAYTRKGAKKLAASQQPTADRSMTQQAVAVAESMLESQQGLESALGGRLEAAGMALKPAEWLLIHVGITFGAGLAALLLTGASPMWMLIGLAVGALGPWIWLSRQRKKRLSNFKAMLADTLQLMAGSLSAGLSLAQSVDTVVREGQDPMAGELRRALVETRLGVEIEDALLGVAERMQSVDFEWVVMAIRIQREVGGNLAELLNNVADTIREREYLERQVKTLSAEGRLSVWILGGLPPVFMAYLALTNPAYLAPMFTNPLGIVMLIVMAILLTAGILWMKAVVKVEI